jgi:hypothetical protein
MSGRRPQTHQLIGWHSTHPEEANRDEHYLDLPAVEDTEVVHAVAPGASLDVILVPANAITSAAHFTAAVTGTIHAAITGHAAVVSISGSHGEPRAITRIGRPDTASRG